MAHQHDEGEPNNTKTSGQRLIIDVCVQCIVYPVSGLSFCSHVGRVDSQLHPLSLLYALVHTNDHLCSVLETVVDNRLRRSSMFVELIRVER